MNGASLAANNQKVMHDTTLMLNTTLCILTDYFGRVQLTQCRVDLSYPRSARDEITILSPQTHNCIYVGVQSMMTQGSGRSRSQFWQ